MYSLSDFQRYQALQSLPLLSDQRPSELMDKMLMLLPEEEKPGFFFRGLFMDRLPADIRSHLLTESISDPRRMALRADELWTIRGKSSTVHMVSDEDFQEVNALQCKVSSGGRKTKPVPSPNPSHGTTVAGELMQLSVVLPVLIWETSKQRGLSEHDSRRFNVK